MQATSLPDARQSLMKVSTGKDMRMSPRMTKNSSASVSSAASKSAATVPRCSSSWMTRTVTPPWSNVSQSSCT